MATQNCVVCGQGSNRTDWINKSGNFVACDSHSSGEVARAVAKVQAVKLVAPAPPTKGVPIPPATPVKK
jgi:hypothetical protein